MAGGRYSAHHGADDAQASGILSGQQQTGYSRARTQRPGLVPLRSCGHPVEGPGRMGGVVLEGQGSGSLHVLHQVGQTGNGGFRKSQHAGGDALLEGGVIGAAVALRAVGPRRERFGIAEGDDLGGVRRFA